MKAETSIYTFNFAVYTTAGVFVLQERGYVRVTNVLYSRWV